MGAEGAFFYDWVKPKQKVILIGRVTTFWLLTFVSLITVCYVTCVRQDQFFCFFRFSLQLLSSVHLSFLLQSVRRTSLLVRMGSACRTFGCVIGSTTAETGAMKHNAVSFAMSQSSLEGLSLI